MSSILHSQHPNGYLFLQIPGALRFTPKISWDLWRFIPESPKRKLKKSMVLDEETHIYIFNIHSQQSPIKIPSALISSLLNHCAWPRSDFLAAKLQNWETAALEMAMFFVNVPILPFKYHDFTIVLWLLTRGY